MLIARKIAHVRSAIVSAILVSLATSACSPSAFFNNGTDTSITNQPTYRKVNPACAQISLRTEELDAPTFRSLLHCFNAYGALNEVEALTNQLSDADIQPLIAMTNQHLLLDKKHLYQTLSSYRELKNQGALIPLFQSFAKIFGNGEFIASGADLMRRVYESNKGAFLSGLAQLSEKANLSSVTGGMEFVSNLGSAPSFESLQKDFRTGVSGDLPLNLITDPMTIYLQDSNHLSLPRTLSRELIGGGLFNVADQLITNNIAVDVGRQSAGLYAVFNQRARVFKSINLLFGAWDGPTACVDATQNIPNGDEHVIDELSRVSLTDDDLDSASNFVAKSNFLVLTLADSVCNFPVELAKAYPDMQSLAFTRAIVPVVQITKAMKSQGYGNRDGLLINILKDGALANLAPALSELAYRGAYPDLLLLASSLRIEDRPAIQSALQFMFNNDSGQSLYDIFEKGSANIGRDTLFNAIRGMQGYVDSNEPILLPAMQSLKKATYLNNVHPILETVHDVLKDAPKSRALYDGLFKMASKPEFAPAIRLIGTMATDGRLEQIVDSLATIYNRYSLQGEMPIGTAVEPVFVNRLRHHLSAGDLVTFDTKTTEDFSSCENVKLGIHLDNPADPQYNLQWDNVLACLNNDHKKNDVVDSVNFLRANQTSDGSNYLDYTVELTQKLSLAPDEKQYISDLFINVLKGTYGAFADQLELIPHLVRDSFQGKGDATAGPVFEPLFKLARPIFKHKGSFDQLAKTLGLMVDPKNPSLQGAFQLTDQIVSKLDDPALQPQPKPETTFFDRPRIQRWIKNKECEYYPDGTSQVELSNRVEELINDYENETINYKFDPSTQVAGQGLPHSRQYRHWTKELLREHLKPILDRLSDSTKTDTGYSTVQALMNFMMSYKDNLKTLQAWIQNRSDHWELGDPIPDPKRLNPKRLLTYMYVNDKDSSLDEPKPRVKIVNSGDLFELVLINADVVAPVLNPRFPKFPWVMYQNSALEFMAELAEAWGDVPYDDWPKKLQARYPRGTRLMTLREAVQKMYDTTGQLAAEAGVSPTVGCKQTANPADDPEIQKWETQDPTQNFGLPDLSSVPAPLKIAYSSAVQKFLKTNPTEAKAHLYNELELLQVMKDNLPDDPRVTDGGLGLFRSLFFELYYSTPVEYRNPMSGSKNNLSFVIDICKLGITHMMLTGASQFKPEDQDLYHLLETFLQGAENSATPLLFDALLSDNPEHKLAWNVIDQFYQTLTAGEVSSNALNLCASDGTSALDESHRNEICKSGSPISPQEILSAKQSWARESDRLKQAGFYILAGAGLPNTLDPSQPTLVNSAIPFLKDTVNSNRDFLAKNTDSLSEILRMETLMIGTRALYEIRDDTNKGHFQNWINPALQDSKNGIAMLDLMSSIDQDSDARGAFATTVHRWKALTDSSSGFQFPQWRVDGVPVSSTQAVLRYFDDPTPSAKQKSALKFRQFVDYLLVGDGHAPAAADEYMKLIAEKPEGFYQIPVTVSNYIKDPKDSPPNTDLEDFFQLVLRTLAPDKR